MYANMKIDTILHLSYQLIFLLRRAIIISISIFVPLDYLALVIQAYTLMQVLYMIYLFTVHRYQSIKS